jgi:hypothetical protein
MSSNVSYDNKDNPLSILFDPQTVRERAYKLLELGLSNRLDHFKVNIEKMDLVAEFVCDVIEENYPDLDIPYHSRWRHFEYGGIDRWQQIKEIVGTDDKKELGRVAIDLAVMSVLLDAGAGPDWKYHEYSTDLKVGRSEGLALASVYMLQEGCFSSDRAAPFRVDSDGLEKMKVQDFERGLQVSNANPLAGMRGRAELLASLGRAMKSWPEIFGLISPRPGYMLDYLLEERGQRVAAADILKVILESFSTIWPGRLQLYGTNLGDVWLHSRLEYDDETNMHMPFHKLSQWLTYSLLEPFSWAGVEIVGLDELTGLAEYRNGGLFIDTGVISLKNEENYHKPHRPSDEIIVEWRALTIALLDELRPMVAERLGLSMDEFPLARLLQGGSWQAGRLVAQERDPEYCEPPLEIISDGTVF